MAGSRGRPDQPASRDDEPLGVGASGARVGESGAPVVEGDDQQFLQALMETSLYSIGAYFSDRHPELVDQVIAESEEIERIGLGEYARREGLPVEQCFETLLTGLALRYYNAVAS